MKKLLLILILLPGLALADHHRQHAIERIDNMQIFIDGSLQNMDFYQSQVTLSPALQKRFDSVYRRFGSIQTRNERVRNALLNYSLPLEDVRRIVNQPKIDTPPHSSLWRLSAMGYSLRIIIGAEPAYDYWLAATIGNIFTIDNIMQGVLWHINDAIREEIYNDPGFQ